MKIITVFFARSPKYNQLLKVFETSLKETMPGVNYKCIKIPKPENIDHKRDTAFAFMAAVKHALYHQKGILAVADCDLMFLKSIENIKDYSFDIAITTRKKMKYNTGLWFMRPTKAAQEFLIQWMIKTEYLMKHFCEKEEFCWQYGGIDQASLHLTIKKNEKAKVVELPCNEWNATQSEWKNVNQHTRVVHVKSALREFCTKPKKKPGEKYAYLNPLINLWRQHLITT
jgi:hypothetical protein